MELQEIQENINETEERLKDTECELLVSNTNDSVQCVSKH
jgi:hypothetical protein